ncbi:MAG: ADP-forming succinate--CoA ligase subunit beta [Chloroflexi bacterium]|nr:ADP-forming succinate--CoA ligase subunit beta [Chloroflexota bacterium]MCL5108007.1 ADP-forming succinate--CoA ligase subunit beta [Chloroflexota bacterium]
MRLYEYQAKWLFAAQGIPTPPGAVATDPEQAGAAAEQLGVPVALKAQVLAGKRGKAGGIRFAQDAAGARAAAHDILGATLNGFVVESLLVEQRLDIASELYLGITTDRSRRCPVAIFSASGGVEIEEVARSEPEKLIVMPIDVAVGFQTYHAMNLALRGGLGGKLLTAVADVASRLYDVYWQYDAEVAEINPLVVTQSGQVVAADARMSIDENALPRQKNLPKNAMPGSDLEIAAREQGLTYIPLDGDICILANGAGLTLATMDLIAAHGGRPANFTEVGGGNYLKARQSLAIALSRPRIKALFVNVFGAFARADHIADGFTQALVELKPDLPIVACIRGTEEETAWRLVRERLGIEPYKDMDLAAAAVVARAYGRG